VSEFCHRLLPPEPDAVAPDGSLVRLLCAVDRASMAHFEFGPGEVSRPVVHRTVEEIWFVLDGLGVLWRQRPPQPPYEIDLRPQMSLTIPVGTAFQFKNTGRLPLTIVGVTIPPWPGTGEAMPADGPWVPSVGSS
jgi:mannose-6-phosphate isomerase-like protein (cupin superfamily)